MNRKIALNLFSFLFVFMFAGAVMTTPALADDSPPPAEDTAPAVVEDQPVEEDIPQLLDEVPEDTQVVVVSESGEALPLASQQAAEAITFIDPIWCPAGVAPKPSMGGCSPAYPNLSSLVAGGTPGGNGTIWIEVGNDSGAEVVINGAGTWSAAKNYSLTLQGGWVGGVSGSKSIVGVSVFDTAISILNWEGAVTINDIVMNNASNTTYNSTGALYVDTTKNIVLSNVSAINTNSGSTDGVYLNNSSSTSQASVTVKNSTFNNNISYGGLNIVSKGAVTLTNINATSNANYGVYINNGIDSVSSPVTINNSAFNGSTSGTGLYINSNGAVKLNQVTAGDNNAQGVYVDNTFASSAQPVTVTGFLTALHNGGNGLDIKSDGAVQLTNLTASHNSGYGVIIENSTSSVMSPVTISGVNVFEDNTYNGLNISSRGAILLNSISATWNSPLNEYSGVYLFNSYDTAKPQNITLTGSNYFQHNGYDGLTAYSYGMITANNLTAIDNGKHTVDGFGDGVYLSNASALTPKPITVNGVNVFTENDAAGLEVFSKGVITVNNITASGNGADGAYLGNSGGISVGVSVKGTNVFTDNSGPGLSVYSKGAITVNNITASRNGNGGVYLDNSGGTSSGVSVNGTNTFNRNSGSGLVVYSKGAITVNNITAYNNFSGGYGAYLFNSYGIQSPITINGYGAFDWNGSDGLYASSNGKITTKNLTAYNNSNNGVTLLTQGVLAPQTVTLSGTNTFNSNGDAGTESGLVVSADGAITVNNINANYNFSDGANLDNYTNWSGGTFTTFGSIKITGFGNFSHNGDQGLKVFTHGTATLNNVSASFNINNDGIGIDADGNVTLMCVSAFNNKWGVFMYGPAVPVLTIKGLTAVGNTTTDEFLSYVTLVRTRCP